MSYSVTELQGGLGQAGAILGVVGGILGPLADAGTTAYATYSNERVQKRDIKARQRELALVLEQRSKEAEIQKEIRQRELALEAIREQTSGVVRARYLGLGLGAIALLGAGALAIYAWGR